MKKQSISALLAQVMYLANEANEKTDKCVFVELIGHVDGLRVYITPSKENFITRISEADVYHVHDSVKHLKNIIRSLQYLIDNGNLNNDRLTDVPKTVYEYHM